MWESDVDLKHQTLLRDLKSTVEGLLSSQVANVWYIYGGLNRLHVDVVKIFKHGCTIEQSGSESDYWRFIKGLQWLQPNTSNSSFSIDCEYRSHLPHTIKEDRASTWLYRCLENHSLSQKLSWLLSDQSHLLSCYHSRAFLCQKDYAEATLICLRAVERNQPSLISEIKPHLFLLPSKEFHKSHRRCSSFPDAHIRENSARKPCQSFDLTLPKCEEIKTKDTERIVVKLRTWKSLPDLNRSSVKIARVRHNTECRSSPVTPIRIVGNDKVSPSLLKVDYDSLQKKVPKKSTLKRPNKTQRAKRVLINNCNIIEHTQSAPKPVMEKSVSSSAPDYSFLSFVSGEKDYTKKPKKTFIEDGGMSVLPMATGFFPRPLKGQSLTSFLMSSQFTRANAELDRENAHFNISEAVISAMEQIRCGNVCADEHQEESDEEINQLKQRIRLRRRMKIVEEQKKTSWAASSLLSDGKTDTTTEASPASMSSSPDTYSGSISSEENVFDLEIDKASNLSDIMELSMSMASLYSEADIMRRSREAPDGAASDALSAEGVALTLISKFSEKQLPRASELVWLVSEEDAPQALLPLPKSWPVSPDDCDELVTSLRGTREWAPPRPQIIFTLHPIISRNDLMAKQNYRCAGCGMRVAKQYASKFRYCNYLGRFFCTGCHSNQLSIIPARVIQNWNFKRFIVSNFSYRLLEQMYTDPLFRVFELNKKLVKNKAMKTCRMFREGLSYLKDFILTCRFADTIQDYLRNERSYLLKDPDVYSMEDLVKVKTGEMRAKFKFIAEMCCKHVYECQLCLARGFICEICKKNDILFPWKMGSVSRCKKCGCCFHITCWKDSEDTPCRRCTRFGRRRESIDNANPAP